MVRKKKEAKEIPNRFSMENEYWSRRAGANIVDVLKTNTGEEDWTTNRKHLFKLKNKRYAVVREAGCSCYFMGDADVYTYDTLKEAKKAYEEINIE